MWHDARTLNGLTSALLGLVLLALVASCVWWLAQRPMFTLRSIRIESVDATGLRHVNALTVRAYAVARIKGNFFTANLETARTAFESVPWVRRATVRRDWPDKLIVTLEEHEPLGAWRDDGRLLSVKGDVFTANIAEAEEDHALPEFGGPEGSEKEVVARFAEFRAWFAQIGLEPESVLLSDRYAWTVRFKQGMSVELGREQDRSTLKQRVDRLIGIYPQLHARLQGPIESVDMRYPNGLALKVAGLTDSLASHEKKTLKK
ncbi:MAG TPA: cell division protein FtsQ/DivIB [Burkholderiaceae bacterium]